MEISYDKIQSLRLPGMARTYKEQEEQEGIEELTFDQRLGILVDAEVDSQRAHKIERLILLFHDYPLKKSNFFKTCPKHDNIKDYIVKGDLLFSIGL